jgi:hypothetical protein
MSSVDKFNRAVSERYALLKKQYDRVITIFAQKSVAESVDSVEALRKTAVDLQDILSSSDQPVWLPHILAECNAFLQAKNNPAAAQLLKDMVERYHQLGPIILSDDSGKYDFDTLYERLREERKLPELFDKMVDSVSKMIDSGEIESVTVIKALQKLLNVLKANKDGSYTSVSQSINYAVFVKNFCLEFLKKTPGVKEYAAAYEKTVQDAEKERDQIEKDLQQESLKLIVDEIQIAKLKQLPNLEPLALHAPEHARIEDHSGDVAD